MHTGALRADWYAPPRYELIHADRLSLRLQLTGPLNFTDSLTRRSLTACTRLFHADG